MWIIVQITLQGQKMEITIDVSEPEDSVSRYAMDTICTGEEALEIPPHWHKVSKAQNATGVAIVLNKYL